MNIIKESSKLSIVLPAYNVGKYIDRCLISCVSQTLKDIEIIVVDDCGPDDSIERSRVWAARDPRIKIVQNDKNLGTYHSRRLGVENSSSRYIIFLDPDDELRLDAAELIYRAAIKSGCDVIFFNCEDIPKKKWWYAKQGLPVANLEGDNIAVEILAAPNMNFGTPGKAYSRSALVNAYRVLGIPSETRLVYAEDVLLFYAVIVMARRSATISHPLYKYYKNQASVTNTRESSSLFDNARQVDDVLHYMKTYSPSYDTLVRKKSAKHAYAIFKKKLMADKYFILRHSKGLNGESFYLGNILKRILFLRKWKDIVRLIAFFSTLGIVRL